MSVNILRSFLKLSVKDEVDESKIEISLEEMSKHCSYDDCWIVIYDKVYDITNFISSVSSHALHDDNVIISCIIFIYK